MFLPISAHLLVHEIVILSITNILGIRLLKLHTLSTLIKREENFHLSPGAILIKVATYFVGLPDI